MQPAQLENCHCSECASLCSVFLCCPREWGVRSEGRGSPASWEPCPASLIVGSLHTHFTASLAYRRDAAAGLRGVNGWC